MKKLIILALLMTLMLINIISIVSAATTEPIIQVTFSTNPIVIAPGTDGYIQLTVKNSGTATADSIKISRVFWNAPITVSENWKVELGALGAGDSTTVLFKFSVLDTAHSGLYPINFDIDYCRDSLCRTIHSNVIINIRSPSVLELVSVKPSSFRAGEKANITFTIANKGSSSITNIVFTWTSSDNIILPLGSDNRVIIPAIDANSYYDIKTEISVNPNAVPGIYPLNILIQYSDRSGTNQTISSIAGIEIGGETDFDVSVQDLTATSTTLAIANIGTNNAYSVVVNIPQQENFRVTGTSTSVIGNLNAGDYTLVSFQITSSTGIYNISSVGERATARTTTTTSIGRNKNLIVEISYTDMLGVRRTVQKEVRLDMIGAVGTRRTTQPITQENQLNIPSGGLVYIGIGVSGIVIIVAIFKLRKIRKRRL